MSVRMTGTERKAFYEDEKWWPERWTHWDEILTVNGVVHEGDDYDIQDANLLVLTGGDIDTHDVNGTGISLESHFRRWRKAQKVATLIVEIEKEKASLFRGIIEQAGGKVKS